MNLKPKTYLFANWKMYLSNGDSRALAQELKDISAGDNLSLSVFPNTLSFCDVQKELADTDIAVGAQHVFWTPQGAYTGAVSAHLFAESGAQYALVGHSERRHVFGEGNDEVRKQLEACVEEGLTPVLCVGETKEDRDADKTEYRVKKQLMKALDGLDMRGNRLIVAYEPVWAIGTGDACDPGEAARMISLITAETRLYIDGDVPVLYGGSVNKENVVSYVAQEEVSGVLVGKASTHIDQFRAMVEALQI